MSVTDTDLDNRLKVLTKDDDSMFIPKKLESVKLAGTYIQAYPETNHTMPASERLYALLCNKNAAAACFVPIAQLISFYATRSNVDTKARILVTQWSSRLQSKWADPASLRVISYHAADGSKIDDAMTGGVLKPIDDGTENSRRPAGVTFAQVELSLDYTDLHWENESTTVRLAYFIGLPVSNVTFNNTAGTAVTRFTCDIQGDPFALSKEEFKDLVLTPCGINGPARLLPAEIGGGTCKLDEEGKSRELQERILQVGHDSIYHKLCEHVAPGHAVTLSSTVEKIKMSYTDENGNEVSMTVTEYYEAKMRGAIPFAEMDEYPINLAGDFVKNLSKAVKDVFDQEDKSYLTLTDLSRESQQASLEKYLARAIACEKKVNAVKSVVTSAIGDTHSFYANVFSALGMPEFSKEEIANGTFRSSAEQTLRKYESKRKFTEEDLQNAIKCWGCNGNHPFKDKHTKEIICPNKDKPGVMDSAAQKHKAYIEKVRKSKRGFVKKSKVKFADLSPEEQLKARQHIAQEASTIAGTAGDHNAPGALNFAIIPVMQTSNHSPTLPLAIDGQLPHISLVLGCVNTSVDQCPKIRAMVDTGACCNTGYSEFWLHILKANPHVIEEVYTTDKGEFQPIILGGVVTGEDGEMANHTTALNLVVKLRLRYETIHHQKVTFSIALGNNVGVNTIVGKTFIKGLQCIYDSLSNVLESKLLNVPPFPITDMYPQRYTTIDKVGSLETEKTYASIVDKLVQYEKTCGALTEYTKDKIQEIEEVDSKLGAATTVATAAVAEKQKFQDEFLGGDGASDQYSSPGAIKGGFQTGTCPDSPTMAGYRARKVRNKKKARFVEPSPISTLRDDYESDEE